jgi:hypothetical protein
MSVQLIFSSPGKSDGVKGVTMKKIQKLLLVILLLGTLTLSACGKKATETPVPVNPLANKATTSWITESIQATQSGLTAELLHVAMEGNDLVLRVKFPHPDWRNWYISKVRLGIEGEEDIFVAQTRFFENLYQKNSNTYCLYQPSYNELEKCVTADAMATYQIDDIIFKDIPPANLEGKRIVFEILELAVGATYCEDLRIPYIEDALSKDFPGLTLDCAEGQGISEYNISEASGYAGNADAQSAVEAMVKQASSSESISGPWTFEIRK